ncbi:hypothetical protein QLY51_15045, partial [Cronobacter sakazakii]|nr:hypothetical protein [Cronobacter sakazakii]
KSQGPINGTIELHYPDGRPVANAHVTLSLYSQLLSAEPLFSTAVYGGERSAVSGPVSGRYENHRFHQ